MKRHYLGKMCKQLFALVANTCFVQSYGDTFAVSGQLKADTNHPQSDAEETNECHADWASKDSRIDNIQTSTSYQWVSARKM